MNAYVRVDFSYSPSGLKVIDAMIEDPACDLPAMIVALRLDLLIQVAGKPRG